MTALLDERLRVLAKQTDTLAEKLGSLGRMAGSDSQTLKSMTRAQAHLMLAEFDLLDAIEANKRRRTPMSEKPFWEGKTCKEMAGLHVKATWKNGTIVTGVLDDTGDIDLGDNRSLYTSRGYDSSCDFEPMDNIQSIELLDDPEYERIDNIENVQVGDIACTTEGNHFRVIDLKPDPLGDMLLRIRISEIDGEYCIDSDDFAYALRRKPKLPDHDGLWWDKDNALWSVAISGLDNSKLVALLIGDPESPVTGSVWSGLNSKHVTSQAPFRPAKAVEA